MTSKEKVIAYIDQNQDKIVEFLMDMVAIPSVNDGSEHQ